MSTRNRIISHSIFWILSISLGVYAWSWQYYCGDPSWFLNVTLSQSSTIVFFYVNYLILVPKFLVHKKYTSFTIFTIINILIHVILCIYFWNQYVFDPKKIAFSQYGSMIYECLFCEFVSSGLRIMEHWISSENKKRTLENELRETELLFLQSQMSPHFLFNTLNNIYGLSLNNSPKTSIAIGQLNDLMHYFQYFEKGEKVLLSHEIEFLEAYISLQSLRNNVNVEFEKDDQESLSKFKIEPMLLLPFIENAFKHGDLNNLILITLHIKNTQLQFQLNNKITINKRKDGVGGIGIKNIERRLELLYPKQHQIDITEKEDFFSLNMTIDLI